VSLWVWLSLFLFLSTRKKTTKGGGESKSPDNEQKKKTRLGGGPRPPKKKIKENKKTRLGGGPHPQKKEKKREKKKKENGLHCSSCADTSPSQNFQTLELAASVRKNSTSQIRQSLPDALATSPPNFDT
jgi:hypothetical protein